MSESVLTSGWVGHWDESSKEVVELTRRRINQGGTSCPWAKWLGGEYSRKWCTLSPVLFDVFLEKIMEKTVRLLQQSENDQFADHSKEDAEEVGTSLSSVSIGGWPVCNFRFANDIDLLGGSKEELQQLTQRMEKTAADYGMEISFDKSKILINSIKPGPSTNIQMNGKV